MAEPRMRVRQKGQQFPTQDIEALLLSFHPSPTVLPSTASVMDEILTDFIIETCHIAALSASYSRRQKIKVDDFKWVLRRDGKKLGRVAEIFAKQRELTESRRAFQFDEMGATGGKRGLGELAGEEDGEEEGKKKRGRKKKRVE
ncbi:transcription initiation factor TFIID subunit 13 [Elsinoe australis]|uniref:Transcription initiation factor TFIID subunit 13 n=1 Tax=Elsinoe australis TaxID=40998 RepID=A0A4U7B2G6_9PEZI|nr:transcription initiation factor TFIID subunit 13 [Elsinoe australis]